MFCGVPALDLRINMDIKHDIKASWQCICDASRFHVENMSVFLASQIMNEFVRLCIDVIWLFDAIHINMYVVLPIDIENPYRL